MTVDEPQRFNVYTDGGCDNGHPKKVGAAAFVLAGPKGDILDDSWVSMTHTTNNRAELRAVKLALERLPLGTPYLVHSDSQYVVEGITKWAHNWKKYGWTTYDKKPVKNRDLWEHLLELTSLHDVKFQWVKGHAGNLPNELCDEICTAQIAKLKKILSQDLPHFEDAQSLELRIVDPLAEPVS